MLLIAFIDDEKQQLWLRGPSNFLTQFKNVRVKERER
jgi:hypothetical protein